MPFLDISAFHNDEGNHSYDNERHHLGMFFIGTIMELTVLQWCDIHSGVHY